MGKTVLTRKKVIPVGDDKHETLEVSELRSRILVLWRMWLVMTPSAFDSDAPPKQTLGHLELNFLHFTPSDT